MDVTTSNFGKMAWKQLKPFIQGKILYGPVNNETNEIVMFGNKTFEEATRLRDFVNALATSFKLLKTDQVFRENFDKLLMLAKTPIVQAIIGGQFDTDAIGEMMNDVLTDKNVAKLIDMVPNILECFSVDRFVPVKDEKELEDVAFKLSAKKLFYAGMYFTTDESTNETSYKLRMDVENTPKTNLNKNRFWFPGPEGVFLLEMRYHRSFIQIQNMVDTAIIKYHKKKQFDEMKQFDKGDDFESESWAEEDTDDLTSSYDRKTDEKPDSSTPSNGSVTESDETSEFTTDSDYVTLSDKEFDEEMRRLREGGLFDLPTTTENSQTTEPAAFRKKRQLNDLLASISSGTPKKSKFVTYEIDDMELHTKQFPYPKYTRDNFKTALYIAQLIQILFFFALIIHIASSVREKIWFKESGNLSVSF